MAAGNQTYLPTFSSERPLAARPTYLPSSLVGAASGRSTYLPSSSGPRLAVGRPCRTLGGPRRIFHGDVVVFDAERVEEELAELLRRGVEAERRHGVGSMSARRLHDEQGDLDWNTRKPTYLPFTPSGAASGRADLPTYLRASRGLRPRDLPTYVFIS